MSDLLFAYGTLIPGCQPPHMRAICSRMELVGEAMVRGTLYDLGSFPGVVEGDGIVRGVVLRVPRDAWASMDVYEGCPISGSTDGLFKRVRTTAQLATGDTVDCWLYVYARGLGNRRPVASGDWRRRGG